MRNLVLQLEPQATFGNIATMEQLVSNSISRPRLYAVLLGIFAGVAVALTAIGIYVVMAYLVAQRTHEIGIRMALGAARADVMSLVLAQSVWVTVVGLVLGLAGAAAMTRYLHGMLFGLTPLDPATFFVVSLLFVFVAALASYVPARRATQVDPMVALRGD
jgi:putative ABC transport system permease protein